MDFQQETGTLATQALFPGSFDPPTLGHMDLVERGAVLFDRIVVAVGSNPQKSPLFTAEERVTLLMEQTSHLPNVSVVSFDGLVIHCAKEQNCNIILRGVRSVADFEFEQQMAMTNRSLSGIETVFIMPSEKFAWLSSRLIKEVYSYGGEAEEMLSPGVAAAVKAKFSGSGENQ